MLANSSFRAITAGIAATCAIVVVAYSTSCSSKTTLYDAGVLDGSKPDGAGGDGGGGDGGGGDGAVQAACKQGVGFGAAAAVAGVAAGDKNFGAVTPDELTIAWVTPNGTVMVADRTNASQPFGAAQSAGTFAHERVALSSDGLTLVVVMPSHKTFGQLTRQSRTVAFSGAPDTAPFKMILSDPMNGESDATPNGMVADPVLSADGTQLFYSMYGLGLLGTVAFSETSGVAWGKPVTLGQDELLATDPLMRRPTGLSADGLTLFFWDEVENKEKAAWRATATSFDLTFSGFLDLGDRKDAQPVASCSRLYFTSPATAPSDVKMADRN